MGGRGRGLIFFDFMRSAVSSIKCLHEKVFYQEPGKFMLTKIIDSTVLGEFLHLVYMLRQAIPYYLVYLLWQENPSYLCVPVLAKTGDSLPSRLDSCRVFRIVFSVIDNKANTHQITWFDSNYYDIWWFKCWCMLEAIIVDLYGDTDV